MLKSLAVVQLCTLQQCFIIILTIKSSVRKNCCWLFETDRSLRSIPISSSNTVIFLGGVFITLLVLEFSSVWIAGIVLPRSLVRLLESPVEIWSSLSLDGVISLGGSSSSETWGIKGDGWLSWYLVGSAPDCYSSSLGSNTDISEIYKMGDISKGVTNTLLPAKNKIRKGLKNILNTE